MDLTGRIALVTGASSGLGLEAAIKLARMGSQVVMVARSRARGEAALQLARRRSGVTRLSLLVCDIASMPAVRELATTVKATSPRLDILINNAGTVNAARLTTPEGIEQTFAANYLGHFLLTKLLLPLLETSRPSRVVNVSSAAHRQATLDFEDLQFAQGGYSIMRAYGRSKLAQILFTGELARRTAGSGVSAYSLHPGAVATGIWSHAPKITRPFLSLVKPFMLSAERAAEAIVYLATSPDVAHQSGEYFERARHVEPSATARDRAVAGRLWTVSERLAGCECTTSS
jgi:NAD(P)-dependent dehydrogenase (short-subunit alcohol dehydrogenase family)